MDFKLSEETVLFRDQLLKFINKELWPLAEKLGPDADDLIDIDTKKALRKKSAELGFWAAHMPEELGGGGLSNVSMHALREASFGTGCPLAFIATPGPEGPTPLLIDADESQRRKFVDPIIRGETSMAFALTEPDVGSDAQSIRTRADKADGGWTINGLKHFITNGQHADFVLLFASNDREKKAQGGITAFLVPQGTPGMKVGAIQASMASATHQVELVFEDCFVPDEYVLGEPGWGFATAMRFLAHGRLAIASWCVGLAQYGLNLALQWAKDRKAFGRPIAKFQAIQWMLADSATEIYAARQMVYNAAWKADQGDPIMVESSMCKLFCSQMVNRVADNVVQIHGGMGVMRESPVERLYRLVRMFRIVEGTDEIQRLIIARGIL